MGAQRTGITTDVGASVPMLVSLVIRRCVQPHSPGHKPYRSRAKRVTSGRRPGGDERGVSEHGIGKMKVWRIASERYRNPVGKHTLIMKNVAGLHNLMYA